MNKSLPTVCLPHLQTPTKEMSNHMHMQDTVKNYLLWKGGSGTKLHAGIRQISTVDSSFLIESGFLREKITQANTARMYPKATEIQLPPGRIQHRCLYTSCLKFEACLYAKLLSM